jgi:hypothetical protein
MSATIEIPAPNLTFTIPATAERIDRTAAALQANGFNVILVKDGVEATATALSLIPDGVSVFDGSSVTLEKIGLSNEIATSTRFNAVRPKLLELYAAGDRDGMRLIGAAPDYMVGSIHAITETGEVVVGSGSGSQLGPYAYSAAKVIWVVGHQKLVGTLDEGLQRVREYTYPKESERLQSLYGMQAMLNKILIVNKEHVPDRVTVILVREELGF